jgi:hypothetical protein
MSDPEAHVEDILSKVAELDEAKADLYYDVRPHDRYERREGRNQRKYLIKPTENAPLYPTAKRTMFTMYGEQEDSYEESVTYDNPFEATSMEVKYRQHGDIEVIFYSDLVPIKAEEADPANGSGFEQRRVIIGPGGTNLNWVEVIEILGDEELSHWSGEQAVSHAAELVATE